MDERIPKPDKQNYPFFAWDIILFLLSTPALFIVAKNLKTSKIHINKRKFNHTIENED
jgi:hypothetical protein